MFPQHIYFVFENHDLFKWKWECIWHIQWPFNFFQYIYSFYFLQIFSFLETLLLGLSSAMTRLSVSLQVIQLQLCTINIVKTFKRYLGISSFLWGLQRKHNIVLPGKVSPTLEVPDSIFKPQYVTQKLSVTKAPPDAEVKSPKQIEGMRKTCSIAASLLKFAGSLIKVRILFAGLQFIFIFCYMAAIYRKI